MRTVKDIQCQNGNWNYDPYMHGLANGLILALSIIEDTDVTFLNPPEKWLVEKKVEDTISGISPELLTPE